MMNTEHFAKTWENMGSEIHQMFSVIETKDQYQKVLSFVDELMTFVSEADVSPHPLDSLINILADQLVAYEALIDPPAEKEPGGILAYLMEDRGLTQSRLSEDTGIDQSTISKLLRGERQFSKAQAKKFADYFHTNMNVFL